MDWFADLDRGYRSRYAERAGDDFVMRGLKRIVRRDEEGEINLTSAELEALERVMEMWSQKE